jgi:long-chain acyl-CoA synthetase
VFDPGLGTLNLAAIAVEGAKRHRNKTAIITSMPDGTRTTLTYAELWERARRVGGALRARGVGPGDRVAVMIPNVADFPVVYYGVLAIGAVVVPVHLLFKRDEILHVLRASGATVLVAAPGALAEAGPAAVELGIDVVVAGPAAPEGLDAPTLSALEADADPIDAIVATNPLDAANILFTSGTTGTPKGAVGTHFALMEQVNVAIIDVFDLQQNDVVFGGLPFFHIFGQTAVMNATLRRGATIVLLPRFDAGAALDLCIREHVTAFQGVPTMFIALLEAAKANPERPPFRWCISGGSALPQAVLERFEETFRAPIQEGYGLTETSPIVAVNPTGVPSRAGSVGPAIWGVDIVIADSEDDEHVVPVPTGDDGEVVVRGHNLFKGYLDNAEATAAAMTDGWFRTGDIGVLSDDGYLTIVDRKKDMIIRNGYNVYPNEVEAVLHRHEDVVSAAVFGVQDTVHGQEVHAALVLGRPDASVEDVDSFVRGLVAGFKHPRVYHVVESLPLGPTGKVLRRELTAHYGG